MKHLLFALLGCCLLLCSTPDTAAARGPTENRFHIGAGFAYGDPFDEDLLPNPWGYGLALRAGFTFSNGLYIGGMADLYVGNESTGYRTAASTQLFGGVLGADLKLAASVSARLAIMGGIHNVTVEGNTPKKPLPATGQPFVAPSLELVMGLGDHFYMCPAARINLFVADDFETMVTWSFSLGASL